MSIDILERLWSTRQWFNPQDLCEIDHLSKYNKNIDEEVLRMHLKNTFAHFIQNWVFLWVVIQSLPLRHQAPGHGVLSLGVSVTTTLIIINTIQKSLMALTIKSSSLMPNTDKWSFLVTPYCPASSVSQVKYWSIRTLAIMSPSPGTLSPQASPDSLGSVIKLNFWARLSNSSI